MQTHAIQPYWNRFGSFFIYPLSMEPLLACIALAALSGLSSLFFTPADMFLQLVLLVVTLRYGYKVLERTARGNLDDGLANIDTSSGGKHRPYKQFVVIAIGLSIVGYSGSVGGVNLSMLVLFLFAMILPANTMLLALTDDLGQSISPPQLWNLMHSIGLPYLGLCACLLLLSSSSGALLGLLMPVIPEMLINVIGGFLGTYFIIVMFRLMGYALYQYHEVLGFTVDIDFTQQAGVVDESGKQRTTEITSLLMAGKYDEAIARLRDDLLTLPNDLTGNLRLHRLLQAIPGQEAAMLAHASGWLPSLCRSGKSRQAAEVLENIWHEQPDFRPALPAHYLPLAEALFETRHYENATRLIKGFDRRFPAHTDIAPIYLLGARLLIDHQRDEAQARRVLEALCQHYPDNPAANEARRLLELLDRLASPASPNPAPAFRGCSTDA